MPWSVIDEQEIVRRYEGDKSLSRQQLAKEYGISHSRVRRILEKYGIEIRTAKKVLQKDEHTEFLRLYFEERVSIEEIARAYGVAETTVRKQIIKDERYKKRENSNFCPILADGFLMNI